VVTIVADQLTEEQAFRLEQQLIDQYGRRDVRENGYLINLTDGGDGPAGVVRSQEYRDARRGRPVPDWVRHRMSEAQKGQKRPKSAEHREKLSQSRVAAVAVLDPEGRVHTVQNRSAFAQLHGLKTSGLINLILGKLKQHHGWTLARAA
jgi:hypothetical protein